ncbi:TMPIT-like protein [Cladochytrium replicatum]|nr:TMPIT-like protein [Cladochytrium replicatum]
MSSGETFYSPAAEELLRDAGKILEDFKALEDKAANYHRLAQELLAAEQACQKELKDQRANAKAFVSRATNASKPATSKKSDSQLSMTDPKEIEEVSDYVFGIRRKLVNLETQFPRPALLVLQMALGKSAPFALRPPKLRLDYKREYELFKLRLTFIITAFAFCNLFVFPFQYRVVFDALYAFSLLYYYSTCVLREHILWVNGSRIRGWWFGHHYLSVFASGVLLIWCTNTSYLVFRSRFLYFSLYLGVVQFLQYRYQRSRLYVLVALDRAGPMDPVMGDGVHTQQLDREFLLLIPFLVVGQLWQFSHFFVLFSEWMWGSEHDWQILVTGILFLCLSIGNMFTTLRTYLSKRDVDKERRSDVRRRARFGSVGSGGTIRSMTPPPPAVRPLARKR